MHDMIQCRSCVESVQCWKFFHHVVAKEITQRKETLVHHFFQYIDPIKFTPFLSDKIQVATKIFDSCFQHSNCKIFNNVVRKCLYREPALFCECRTICIRVCKNAVGDSLRFDDEEWETLFYILIKPPDSNKEYFVRVSCYQHSNRLPHSKYVVSCEMYRVANDFYYDIYNTACSSKYWRSDLWETFEYMQSGEPVLRDDASHWLRDDETQLLKRIKIKERNDWKELFTPGQAISAVGWCEREEYAHIPWREEKQMEIVRLLCRRHIDIHSNDAYVNRSVIFN